MKKEEAKELGDGALADLASALASGKSAELETYLRMASKFTNYSFGNVLLICQQKPDASRVAGFQAWKSLGRTVMKGEKGICILAPLIRKKDAEESESDKEVFGYRAVHVFDVSQTEGEELPEVNRVEGDPGEKLDRLAEYVRSLGIELTFDDDLSDADGVSKIGAIAVDDGLSDPEKFSVIVHEVAHELLHSKKDRKELSHAVKELEAESVAFVVGHSVGLSNSLAAANDYIQGCGGDVELLAQSLQRIQKTADKILCGLSEIASATEAKALT